MRSCPSRRRTHWICVPLTLAGCVGGSGMHGSTSAGAGVLRPSVALEPFEPRLEVPLVHPTLHVELDDILSSPVLLDPEFERAVGSWVDYWKGPAGRAVPAFLGRMTAYESLVDSAIAARDLPPSLRFLPFIESGYNPVAASRARAVGMWQFMESTARERGLEISALLDQRRDPVRSTDEALGFLSELHDELGSWFWVLAAYNSGPNRVRRILRTYASDAPPTDSLFWALRGHFPSETRDFVPKLIGAVVVGTDPAAHGYEATVVDPFHFDEVRVPDATTLDVVARAAGVSQNDIERLNPEYLRRMTPPGRPSTLRVPYGLGETFAVAYAQIPPAERVSYVLHRVADGETLSHIALRYGVRVADIEAANPGIRARFLRVGRTLTVPVAPSARNALQATGG